MEQKSPGRFAARNAPLVALLDNNFIKNSASPIAAGRQADRSYAQIAGILSSIFSAAPFTEGPVENIREAPFTTLFSIAEMAIISIVKSDAHIKEALKPAGHAPFMAGHALNVALLSCRVGMEIDFSFEQLSELGVAALLHDTGMLRIGSDCYLQPRPLSKTERDLIREHPDRGRQFFEKIEGELPWLVRVAAEEHIRKNGQGYPESCGDLHPYSTIIGICDVFEALTHTRPFRKAYHPADVMKIFSSGGDDLFDRDVRSALSAALAAHIGESAPEYNELYRKPTA